MTLELFFSLPIAMAKITISFSLYVFFLSSFLSEKMNKNSPKLLEKIN